MPKSKTLWFASRKYRSCLGLTTDWWSFSLTVFCCYLGGFRLSYNGFNPYRRTIDTGFALLAPYVHIQEGQCYPVAEEHWKVVPC